MRLSADGEAFVFHDADLARMTGAQGRFGDLSAGEIEGLRLQNTPEAPPRLEAVLAVVPEEAVVLVELKTAPGGEGSLERRVAAILERRPRLTAVIGFDPAAHAWFRENRPQIPRGLNLHTPDDLHAATPHGPALDTAAPDFLLPGLGAVTHPRVQRARAGGAPLVTWTSRSSAADAEVRPWCDAVIFEGYRP